MSDSAVRDLARRAGILVDWVDYLGARHVVAPDTLRHVLGAMGLPADAPGDLAASRAGLDALAQGRAPPPLATGIVGRPIDLPVGVSAGGRARLVREDGDRTDMVLDEGPEGGARLAAIDVPGYHRLLHGGRETVLAIAPARCFGVRDAAPRGRPWGLAAQLYGIRRRGDGGIGDFTGAATLAEAAARHGADALALSPCHALFAAEPGRFGPYAPSSRLFLNVLHGDPALVLGADRVAAAVAANRLRARADRLEALALIDWPEAARTKLGLLRTLFETAVPPCRAAPADLRQFRRDGGALLEEHARFEAIHAAQIHAGGEWSWRRWPEALGDPRGPGVAAFARTHAREVAFHVFLQWIADRSRAAAQARARAAGMRIGLVADMAVGMDGDGSHAWGRRADVMTGLGIGAPPDLLNTAGQNWGLTGFSPRALVEGGFAPFVATLRAVMRDAGGVRIDHAMGLARLWVVPEGAPATAGAYITYPLADLLRLTALESHRHRAVVIGEDLGTVPAGFRRRLDEAGIYGMRVLWFERDGEGFLPPERWSREAAAMTTTHDLPPVAGWWRGEDVRLRGALAGLPAGEPGEVRRRTADRRRLWSAFVAAGVAAGRPPAAAEPAVDAAVRFVARAPSRLMLLPVEDALGLAEQPNLPGTIDEHPNWRRRLPAPAATLLDAPAPAARLRTVRRERERR